MRMWMINPKLLCNRHLLGEHGELHKFLPSFHKKHKVDGRIYPIVQIELSSYKARHDELATEMLARGFNHNSPINEADLPDFSYLPSWQFNAKVNPNTSKIALSNRCSDCEKLILAINI